MKSNNEIGVSFDSFSLYTRYKRKVSQSVEFNPKKCAARWRRRERGVDRSPLVERTPVPRVVRCGGIAAAVGGRRIERSEGRRRKRPVYGVEGPRSRRSLPQ